MARMRSTTNRSISAAGMDFVGQADQPPRRRSGQAEFDQRLGGLFFWRQVFKRHQSPPKGMLNRQWPCLRLLGSRGVPETSEVSETSEVLPHKNRRPRWTCAGAPADCQKPTRMI